MEITTKYEIGQRVFFMCDNHVCEGTIVSFRIGFGYWEGSTYPKVSYRVRNNFSSDYSIKEENLFLTKEELLKSL